MSDLHAESRTVRLHRALTELLAQTPEVEAASVVSFDGLPMAACLPPSMDEDRVAAMSAALLSLGERAAEGLGRGELSQVYIEGDNGTVFLVSCDDEAVLVAVAAQGAKVGMMLFEVRHTARQVAEILRVDEPAHEPMLSVVQAVQSVPVEPVMPVMPAGPVEHIATVPAQVMPLHEAPAGVEEPAAPTPAWSSSYTAPPAPTAPEQPRWS